MKYKFYMTASLNYVEETEDLHKVAASVIPLPDINKRQPDLAYFTSRFVSSGTNLNNAHFMGSELVKARNSVVAKAVDVEHAEDEIIGHIYACEFTDKKGVKLDITELAQLEADKLDTQDMHIEIASVVYKTRFPSLANEIKNGDWKVSMEAYYTSYDVLVGNTLMTAEEAQLMGFDVANENLYGKSAKIVKSGEVVDQGTIVKVLRGICFSGVGIVKNPANKPSIVFEATAGVEEASEENDTIMFDYAKLNNTNNVTSTNVDVKITAADDSPGICVYYDKEVIDSTFKDQDSKVIHTDWCNKFSTTCTSTGDYTSSVCLAKVYTEDYLKEFITEVATKKLHQLQKNKEVDKLVDIINTLVKK